MSRPHVVSHALISVDGRSEGFPLDITRYYELAARLPHDAVLAGSGTMVAAAAAADVDLAAEDERPPAQVRTRIRAGPCWSWSTARGS